MVTIVGLIIVVVSPDVAEVLMSIALPAPDAAVFVWGFARTVGAVVVVAGLLIFAAGVGYLRGLRHVIDHSPT